MIYFESYYRKLYVILCLACNWGEGIQPSTLTSLLLVSNISQHGAKKEGRACGVRFISTSASLFVLTPLSVLLPHFPFSLY